jgi:hypothetical protein
MTTFQDPPPQSRRAVRQSERGETPTQAAPYTFDPAAGTPQESAAAPHTGRRAQLPPTEERVPAPPTDSYPTQPPTGESTLANQPPPSVQSNSVQSNSVQSNSEPDTGQAVAVQPGQPGYRVRDFSPEGRRSALGREQFQSVADAPPPTAAFAPPAQPVDLDYHTQGDAPMRARGASVPQPAEGDPQNHTLSRRELRELRAAAEAQAPALQLPESIDTLLNSGPIEIPTLAPPPGQSQALAEAMAEFDLLTRSRREAEARARDAQVASLQHSQSTPPQEASTALESAPVPYEQTPDAPTLDEQTPDAPTDDVESAPVASAPAPAGPVLNPLFGVPQSASAFPSAQVPSVQVPSVQEPWEQVLSVPVPSVEAPSEQIPSEQIPSEQIPAVQVPSVQVPSAPVPSAEVSSVPAPAAEVASVPVPSVQVPSAPQPPVVAAVDPVFIEPQSAPTTRPTGHWSVQAAMDDDEHPFENTRSRTVGSNTSAITTSALVLPSVPQPSGVINTRTSTGEILVTGSIDLPRSLGSTGAHPHRVDNSDFEDDPLDSQVSSPDSAPVRAIRAVSTHTSTRGVIESKGPQNNRLLTIVIATASVLCVGVVGFLVFAFATHQL